MNVKSTFDMHFKMVPFSELLDWMYIDILSIRNDDSVRKWMYSDHLISKDEHEKWLAAVLENETCKYFAIINGENKPVGVVGLTGICQQHKKSDWIIYLSPDVVSGLGAAVEYFILDYFFEKMDFEKLCCQVLEGNSTVVKLHEKFLFKQEGFLESQIIKNEKRIGVYLLGLSKDKWKKGREDVYSKYSKVLSKFEVAF